MFDSFTEPASVGQDLLRGAFSLLDRPAYALLGLMYQLFFNVATADVLSNEIVMKFYSRVQIVLGVFMMFQLAMTILRGIVNPDNFGKDNSTLITRVVTALVLFTLLMPIGSGGGNEFEKQVNNNGLLFGTLYSLQHRLLSNNTIGRLVLGTNDSNVSFSDTATATGDTELKKSARIFTSTILKGFYRINLVPEDQRVNRNDGKDPAVYNDNRVCTDIDDSILAAYTRVDAEPGEILSLVNATCDSAAQPGFLNSLRTGAQKLIGTTKYIFTYTPVISTITAIVFVFILLSFSIDVAVRAIKLAILRLIAPIPIISYMDPKGSKDSSFNAWVKALTSTYLDLFVRLASVYFVIYIIQDMIVNGVSINTTAGDGIIHTLTVILIFIGLFIFAKQAPKFIKQVLGLKDEGGKLFGGLSEAIGIGAIGAGAVGSFNASRTASKFADLTNNKDPNTILNRGKHLIAGIAGAGAGVVTGATAYMGAKDHYGKTVMDAMEKRNATAIQRGGSGSTVFGRLSATGHRLVQGEGATTFDSQTREIAQKKGIEKSAKDLFSYLEGKGKTDGAGYTVTTSGIDALGVDPSTGKSYTVTGSLNEYSRLKSQALADQQRGIGDGSFTFSGHTINAHDAVATKIEEELGYAAGDKWALEQEAKGENMDNGYRQKRDTYNESLNGVNVPKDSMGNPKHSLYTRYEVKNGAATFEASKLKKTSKAAGGEASRLESSDAYKKKQADFGATKK